MRILPKQTDRAKHVVSEGRIGVSLQGIGIGPNKGEVEQDEEGLRTMQILSPNMAWLLKRVREG